MYQHSKKCMLLLLLLVISVATTKIMEPSEDATLEQKFAQLSLRQKTAKLAQLSIGKTTAIAIEPDPQAYTTPQSQQKRGQ